MTQKELDDIFHATEHLIDRAYMRWYNTDTMMTFEEWFRGSSCERHYNNLLDIINTYREK